MSAYRVDARHAGKRMRQSTRNRVLVALGVGIGIILSLPMLVAALIVSL